MALDWLWWRAWVSVDAVVAAAVGVASVALCDIDFRFAWQTWHLVTSTSTLCGRRGTSRHRPSLCRRGDIVIIVSDSGDIVIIVSDSGDGQW